MVVFYGIQIANEVFLATIFIPIAFAFWYYRRVLSARQTKILYDDTSGDATVYTAIWDITNKTVIVKVSRKIKITLKKVASPKRIFVPPYSTQIWFKGKEGSNETQRWEDADDKKGKFDLGYEVASMTHHWLDQIKMALGLSIKNPIVYMALLGGFGIGAFVIFLVLILSGNM